MGKGIATLGDLPGRHDRDPEVKPPITVEQRLAWAEDYIAEKNLLDDYRSWIEDNQG